MGECNGALANRQLGATLVDCSEPLVAEIPSTMADYGVLLVGHGTRRTAGQQQLRQVFAEFGKRVEPCPSALGFLELAEPDIATAVRQLADRGVRTVVTVPVLLFSAGHAQRDIPEAVRDACLATGLAVGPQTPALESSSAILQLSATRFRQAICRRTRDLVSADRKDEVVVCSQECTGDFCPQVGLAMIGRGSRSAQATQDMLQFAASRMKLTPVAWNGVGFIHAQSPSVPEVLDQLQASECPLLVVQPHLLFEGELVDELRGEVARRQAQDASRTWRITGTLGVDERLSETLAQMARSVLPNQASFAR